MLTPFPLVKGYSGECVTGSSPHTRQFNEGSSFMSMVQGRRNVAWWRFVVTIFRDAFLTARKIFIPNFPSYIAQHFSLVSLYVVYAILPSLFHSLYLSFVELTWAKSLLCLSSLVKLPMQTFRSVLPVIFRADWKCYGVNTLELGTWSGSSSGVYAGKV